MMKLLLLVLFPFALHSQPVINLTYRLKEVHKIQTKKDSTLDWTVDTISYHVPFEIKFTKTKVAIDGYGTFKIVGYQDKSHEGTTIHHWIMADKSYITQIEKLMYWVYPFVKGKSKLFYFKIE